MDGTSTKKLRQPTLRGFAACHCFALSLSFRFRISLSHLALLRFPMTPLSCHHAIVSHCGPQPPSIPLFHFSCLHCFGTRSGRVLRKWTVRTTTSFPDGATPRRGAADCRWRVKRRGIPFDTPPHAHATPCRRRAHTHGRTRVNRWREHLLPRHSRAPFARNGLLPFPYINRCVPSLSSP